MAIIGRRRCGYCGFESAHVRRNEGKQPYVYCPECGLGTQAKNGSQAALLTKGMRPEPGGAPGHVDVLPPAGPGDITAAPPAPPKPAAEPPKPKKQSWLSGLSTLIDGDHK